MSVPARMPTHFVAIALVRVKRGSTWITFAPRSRASITHWKPTGWFSAMFEPMITMQSEFCEILLEVRRAASSERGPQTGDRGAVSYAGLVLDLHDAERRHQLLDQVVLFVVERRAAEVADRHRAVRRRRRPRVRPARSPRACRAMRSAIMSIAVSSVELLPRGAVRAAVLDLRTRAAGSARSSSTPDPSGRGGRARSGSPGRPRCA